MPNRFSPQSVTSSSALLQLYSRLPIEKWPSASICVPTCAVISIRSMFTPTSLVAPIFRRRRIESRQLVHNDIRYGVWFGIMNGAFIAISWLTSKIRPCVTDRSASSRFSGVSRLAAPIWSLAPQREWSCVQMVI